MRYPLKDPRPDFEELARVLRRGREPRRVHFIDEVDPEVMSFLAKEFLNIEVPPMTSMIDRHLQRYREGGEARLLSLPEEKAYIHTATKFWYHMGYDVYFDMYPLYLFNALLSPHLQRTSDTAGRLSRGEREWADEGEGLIRDRSDFEHFPWNRLRLLGIDEYYEFIGSQLPDGMRIVVNHAFFETVLESLLGFRGLFRKLYRDPDLVKAVFDRLAAIVLPFCEAAAASDAVGALLYMGDIAYKKGLLISPAMLREYALPWHREFAAIAHRGGKMHWYHSCGRTDEIMEDLIEDIMIDAFHGFEDVCCPVTAYKAKYGHRIGLIGGVDMDKLCRLDEQDLRRYVRTILETCMPGGGYALGSGNSIANYVPFENYLIMMEEGHAWGR